MKIIYNETNFNETIIYETNTDETSASNSVNYYIYDSTCHLKSVNKTEFTLKVG